MMRMFAQKAITPDQLRMLADQLTPPIDPVKIAAKIGINVFETDFTRDDGENVSGVVAIENRTPVIYVNRADPMVRKRFTISHEIGHVCLGHLLDDNKELIDDEVRLRSSIWNKEEQSANEFAAKLLMPSSLIRAAIESGTDTVETLADLFFVSQKSMTYRLESLGY